MQYNFSNISEGIKAVQRFLWPVYHISNILHINVSSSLKTNHLLSQI